MAENEVRLDLTRARTVGITQAKQRFYSLTRRAVEEGRSIVVMKRNRPWILLTPLAGNGDDGGDDEL